MSHAKAKLKKKLMRAYWVGGLTFFTAIVSVRCGIDPTANRDFSTAQSAEDSDLRVGASYNNGGAFTDPRIAGSRAQITDEQVEQLIEADLRAMDRNQAVASRYFTLTNLWNAGADDGDMELFRAAISKFMNHLSYQRTIVVPQAIDPNRTIFRIDLRAYGWRRFFWDEIQRRNPYALFSGSRSELFARQIAASNFPVHARADWFAFNGLQNPLYAIIMQQPRNLRTLEFNILGINTDLNLARGNVLRIGKADSNVSQQNRIVELHRTRFGSYWKSLDFEAHDRRTRRNIFEFALDGRIFGAFTRGFDFAGGEMIYTLPNGLNGYYISDARGVRLDEVPQNVAIDTVVSKDFAVKNAVSCIGCHDAGFKTMVDEIRGHVERNAFAFRRAEVEVIRRLHPEANVIAEQYRQDLARFAQAMQQVGWPVDRVVPGKEGKEPVSYLAKTFDDDLNVTLVAAELGVTPAQLEQGLRRSLTFSRRFGNVLIEGGEVNRQTFEDNFPFLIEFFGKGRALFRRGLFNLAETGGGAYELEDAGDAPDAPVGASFEEMSAAAEAAVLAAGEAPLAEPEDEGWTPPTIDGEPSLD